MEGGRERERGKETSKYVAVLVTFSLQFHLSGKCADVNWS